MAVNNMNTKQYQLNNHPVITDYPSKINYIYLPLNPSSDAEDLPTKLSPSP